MLKGLLARVFEEKNVIDAESPEKKLQPHATDSHYTKETTEQNARTPEGGFGKRARRRRRRQALAADGRVPYLY